MIINIEQIKKLDIEFAEIIFTFHKKHKLTDGEILLLMKTLEQAIILKSYREIILVGVEKLIEDKLDDIENE